MHYISTQAHTESRPILSLALTVLIRPSTLTHLDINAGDVSTAKELHMMLVLVDGVVVDASVLAGVPVKHKLAIVEATHALLASNDAEVALL